MPHLLSFSGRPWCLLALFVAASFLMIWRLENMEKAGVEGTVLGTLIMPYCSGIGNIIFAFVLARTKGPGREVLVNSLVNNTTNLTLLIGLPAVLWGLSLNPPLQARKKKGAKAGNHQKNRINRLSLLLTLSAVWFFTGTLWALGRDGKIDFGDGLVLVGIFLFWQCFQVFDVLKQNVRENKTLRVRLLVDLVLLLAGAYGIYASIDGLVAWVNTQGGGWLGPQRIGWLSGWLMVLPNASLALFYGWKKRGDIVFSSQIGDGHISIPLVVGIFALYRPFVLPAFFNTGVAIILGGAAIHFFFLAIFGHLHRPVGLALCALYAFFVYRGFVT